MKLLESAVEAELTRRVEAAGGLCDKVVALGSRGYFDRVVVLPGGRVVFVETKRPRGPRGGRGGKVSANQLKRHADYRQRGCEVRVVHDSADIDRLLAGLPSGLD